MNKKPPSDDNNEIFLGEEEIPGQYHDDPMQNQDIIPSPDADVPTFEADEVEIENPVSQVSSPPAKNILIFGILIIVSIIFLYKFVFKESDKVIAEKKKAEEIAAQPVNNAKPATPPGAAPQVNIGVVDTPELPVGADDSLQSLPPLPATPELPATGSEPQPNSSNKKLTMPTAPAPVVAPVVVQEPAKIDETAKDATKDTPQAQPKIVDEAQPNTPSEEEIQAQIRTKELATRKMGMLVLNGGGTPKDDSAQKVTPTSSVVTKVGDLSLMILQGKMIEAVLETTINTDLPGSLRAVINRDIYAESGKNILIPSGSRLIGNYGNSVSAGQQRLLVTWGRIVRPDGVSVSISSQGTDQLGRSGMAGIVDNKYKEMFANAFLTSTLAIASTIALSGTQKTITSSTSSGSTANGGGSTTTQSATPTDAAILQGVQNITNVGNRIAMGESTTPTIIINQGAKIMVYVSQDISFPASFVNEISNMN
jgi:type IV secretion system protein VirB10